MAYETPTADDFRTKFPEFEDLSDTQIDALIVEAMRSVDTTWTEGDYENAILYLAAHYHQLATNASESSTMDTPGGQAITSEHIGPISVSYGKASGPTGANSTSSLSTTAYGQMYYDLLVKNVPAILVI